MPIHLPVYRTRWAGAFPWRVARLGLNMLVVAFTAFNLPPPTHGVLPRRTERSADVVYCGHVVHTWFGRFVGQRNSPAKPPPPPPLGGLR